MCFGGGSKAPPAPEPVAPTPPKVNTTEQTAPASTDEDNTATNIAKKKKGTSNLTIPLTSTSGSGVQVG